MVHTGQVVVIVPFPARSINAEVAQCRQRRFLALVLLLLGLVAAVPAALAQGRPDPAKLLAAQREALAKLAFMDGVWRGPATTVEPGRGETHEITQTERVGPMLDGAVKVIEGRGYAADGSVAFNALGIVSYDPGKQAYTMRSYAMGNAGDFALTPTADGFTWEIPAGLMTIRYSAVIKDGTWHEVGDRIMPGSEPVRFFEMTLTRVGDTTWPAGEFVPRE